MPWESDATMSYQTGRRDSIRWRQQVRWSLPLVGLALLIAMFLYRGQGDTAMIPASAIHPFLYFPDRVLVATPAEMGLDYENVYLTTEDGMVIHGWYLPRHEPLATLYFLHGNAGNISHRLEMLHRLHQAGFQLFILDYRGYGRSQGNPNEAGTYQDALAGWHWLQERSQGGPPRIFFGRSLGGAVATWLAAQEGVTPDGLILEGTFTRLRDMASVALPLPGLGRWIPDMYPTLDRIGQIHSPLLIIHGEADEMIPVEHAHRLFAAAAEPKSLYLVPGARHNDTPFVGGSAYVERLRRFAREVRGRTPAGSGGAPTGSN